MVVDNVDGFVGFNMLEHAELFCEEEFHSLTSTTTARTDIGSSLRIQSICDTRPQMADLLFLKSTAFMEVYGEVVVL